MDCGYLDGSHRVVALPACLPASQYNFSHYVYRFNNMPVNSGVIPAAGGANIQGMPNNFYYR